MYRLMYYCITVLLLLLLFKTINISTKQGLCEMRRPCYFVGDGNFHEAVDWFSWNLGKGLPGNSSHLFTFGCNYSKIRVLSRFWILLPQAIPKTTKDITPQSSLICLGMGKFLRPSNDLGGHLMLQILLHSRLNCARSWFLELGQLSAWTT